MIVLDTKLIVEPYPYWFHKSPWRNAGPTLATTVLDDIENCNPHDVVADASYSRLPEKDELSKVVPTYEI